MKLSDYQVGQYIKALIAGQPGRAKTTAGLTFPTPMLIFDFEDKLSGPVLWAKQHGIDLSKIEVLTPRDWHNNWDELCKLFQQFRRDPDKFKSFGTDSLTSLADYLLGYTSDKKVADGKGVTKIGGVTVAGIDEFNAESSGIMDYLLFMREVRAHVWLTAHYMETKTTSIGDANKVIVSRSLITGAKKTAAKIPVYFKEVYSFNIEQSIKVGGPVKYVCHTQTNEEDFARTEFPLPAKFEFTNELFFSKLAALAGLEHKEKVG